MIASTNPARHPRPLPARKPLAVAFFLLLLALTLFLFTTPYAGFALLPGLAILAIALLFLYQRPAYLFLVFLFPFRDYTAFMDVSFLGALSPQKFLGFWLFVVLAVMAVLKKRTSQGNPNRFWPWLLLFFLVNCLSAIVSPYPDTSFANLFKMLTPVILFALTVAYVDLATFTRFLPWVLILSVTTSLALTIFNSLRSGDFANFIENFFDLGPNAFSILLIFPLPFLVHRFTHTQRAPHRILFLLLSLGNVAGIIMFQSRAGTILLLLTTVAIVFQHRSRFRPLQLGIIAATLLIVIILILTLAPSSYWERQKTITAGKADPSIASRASYINVALDSWRKNPILGEGPGTFYEIYKKSNYALHRHIRTQRRENNLGRRAHNTFLEVLVGSGTLGLSLYLAMIILALRNFHSAGAIFIQKGREDMASLVRAYRLSFSLMLVYFLFISDFHHHYFWISLALSQSALNLASTMEARPAGGREQEPVPEVNGD